MTTITRLGYCENCAKEHRPKTGQEFLVQGSSHREPKIMKAIRNGRAGFVPHLYRITGFDQIRHKVYYQRLCSMEGCGTYTYETDTHHCLDRVEDQWSTILVTKVSNWNALVLFKDTGFTI
jgi:hypothetical protein